MNHLEGWDGSIFVADLNEGISRWQNGQTRARGDMYMSQNEHTRGSSPGCKEQHCNGSWLAFPGGVAEDAHTIAAIQSIKNKQLT